MRYTFHLTRSPHIIWLPTFHMLHDYCWRNYQKLEPHAGRSKNSQSRDGCGSEISNNGAGSYRRNRPIVGNFGWKRADAERDRRNTELSTAVLWSWMVSEWRSSFFDVTASGSRDCMVGGIFRISRWVCTKSASYISPYMGCTHTMTNSTNMVCSCIHPDCVSTIAKGSTHLSSTYFPI